MFRFENFFNNQEEICFLENLYRSTEQQTLYLEGKSGNGITHLLHAVCNTFTENGLPSQMISARWMKKFLKDYKNENSENVLINELTSTKLLAIDNTQEFYFRSKRELNFILNIIQQAEETGTFLLFGSSSTTASQFKKITATQRIKKIYIKSPDIDSVTELIHHFLEYENTLKKEAAQKIAYYNGTSQQYINCLIDLRYSKGKNSIGEETAFNTEINTVLRKHFSGPQFRKCFLTENNELISYKDFNRGKKIFTI